MKIELFEEENILITITDEELDNDNFVDLIVKEDDKTLKIMVDLDELSSALAAFLKKRQIRLEREERYDEERYDDGIIE